jgi:hypothetical protein
MQSGSHHPHVERQHLRRKHRLAINCYLRRRIVRWLRTFRGSCFTVTATSASNPRTNASRSASLVAIVISEQQCARPIQRPLRPPKSATTPPTHIARSHPSRRLNRDLPADEI